MKFREVLCRSARGVLAAVTVAVLAACGGGERVDPFVPQKIVAFGDESSFIDTDGRKYTINAMNSDGTAVDCTNNVIWVQYLAASFGMGFSQCPAGREVRATTLAAKGAKVADVATVVQNYIANNTIGSKDLFTVYAGQNDLIEIYELVPTGQITAAEAVARAEAAGTALAQQVNALAVAGGRVLFVPIPDVSLTPYGRQRDAALLKTMSAQFNTKLISAVINDGRAIGLVSAEEMSQVIAVNPALFGYTNVTDAACLEDKSFLAAVGCRALDSELVSDATGNKGATFFWAGDRYMSPAAHARLGGIADTRTRNNPF